MTERKSGKVSRSDLTRVFRNGKALERLADAPVKERTCDVQPLDFFPVYGVINYLDRLSERFLRTKNCVPDAIYFLGLLGWNALVGYATYRSLK